MKVILTATAVVLLGLHCFAETPESQTGPQVAQATTLVDGGETPSSLKTGGQVIAMSRHIGGKSIQTLFPEPQGTVWVDDDPNPPLSAIDAIRLAARKRKEILPDTDAYTWHLTGAELKPWDTPRGFWYWSVSFNFKINDETGLIKRPTGEDKLSIIVLMNGKVVEPEVVRPDR